MVGLRRRWGYSDFTVVANTPPTPPTVTNTDAYQPGVWRKVGTASEYLHSDMLGTLRLTTGTSGSAGASRVFTAFGERIAGTNDRFGYVGAWGYQSTPIPESPNPDTAFPFLHVGARYYDPSSGRFLQRDPIGILGGLNVYAYVANTPTDTGDPAGLSSLLRGDGLIVLIDDGLTAGGRVVVNVGGKVIEIVGSRTIPGGVEYILRNGGTWKVMSNWRIRGELVSTCGQIIISPAGVDLVWITVGILLIVCVILFVLSRGRTMSVHELADSMNASGTPSAVESLFLWKLLSERRGAATITVKDGRIRVFDSATGHPLNLGENADPGVFQDPRDVETFMGALKQEAGYLRSRTVRIVPTVVSPPFTYAFIEFRDEGNATIGIQVTYDIPRWKWRVRKLLWELGNKCRRCQVTTNYA